MFVLTQISVRLGEHKYTKTSLAVFTHSGHHILSAVGPNNGQHYMYIIKLYNFTCGHNKVAVPDQVSIQHKLPPAHNTHIITIHGTDTVLCWEHEDVKWPALVQMQRWLSEWACTKVRKVYITIIHIFFFSKFKKRPLNFLLSAKGQLHLERSEHLHLVVLKHLNNRLEGKVKLP